MEHSKFILRNAVVCMAVVVLLSCSKSSETAQDVARGKLTSGPWKISLVKANGVDVTGDYRDFTLTFADAGYNTTNGLPAWPPSGLWTFTDDTGTAFVRDDQAKVSITTLEAAALTLEMTLTDQVLSGGRGKSVSKPYVFFFTK